MNYRFVSRQLGLLMIVLSLSILAVAVWSGVDWWRGDTAEGASLLALLETVGLGLLIALVLWRLGRGDDNFLGRREALLLVALSWLVGAGLGSLPFFLWAYIRPADSTAGAPFESFASCYFETMSGLTTTGATVLSDIEGIPKGLLLWRAVTHWLGGLGIVVLFVAVLPTLGVGGKKLFKVESTGPTTQGVRPRIRETARLLWMIYLGMTFTLVVLLRLCGMGWYDSVCHTFATLATGGFSTRNASVGEYNSIAIDSVLIVFMVLSGINFGLYYQVIRGRFRSVWTDPELRLYFGIILFATIIVTVNLMADPLIVTTVPGETQDPTILQALRYGLFQVVSIQTTTGYCTSDFDQWSFTAKGVLILLMFVGGCAGSTGGGIKVIRCLIAFKVMIAEVERVFNPNVVRTIKAGKSTIDPEVRLGTLVYILGIGFLFMLGAVLLMWFEPDLDFTTAATASIATLNNVGPGLARVGAIENYGWFGAPSKIVLSVLMALGRLEVYAIFVLFVPRFWRGD